jgi:hypothetical protein
MKPTVERFKLTEFHDSIKCELDTEELWELTLRKDKRSFSEFFLEDHGVVIPCDVTPEDLSNGTAHDAILSKVLRCSNRATTNQQ